MKKTTTSASRSIKGLPFRALLKNIIVETLSDDEFTTIGKKKIILLKPTELQKSSPKGRVVSVGDEYTGDLKPGDIVLYDMSAGRLIKFKNKEYWNMAYLDIHTAFQGSALKEIEDAQSIGISKETTHHLANPQGDRKV